MRDNGSPKTVEASSNPTPCLVKLNRALRKSHSKVNGTTRNYFAMQMFFGSVKNRSASSPPSRPTPLAFIPPNGTLQLSDSL